MGWFIFPNFSGVNLGIFFFGGGEGDVPKAFRTTWIFDINMINWVVVEPSPFENYAQ